MFWRKLKFKKYTLIRRWLLVPYLDERLTDLWPVSKMCLYPRVSSLPYWEIKNNPKAIGTRIGKNIFYYSVQTSPQIPYVLGQQVWSGKSARLVGILQLLPLITARQIDPMEPVGKTCRPFNFFKNLNNKICFTWICIISFGLFFFNLL